MFEVLMTDKADRQLKKLDSAAQHHIIAVLERARIRPEAFAVRLIGSAAYRLRAGDYRIIVSIDNHQLIILVLSVGHRRNIYK